MDWLTLFFGIFTSFFISLWAGSMAILIFSDKTWKSKDYMNLYLWIWVIGLVIFYLMNAA